jgi:hypothetical protein
LGEPERRKLPRSPRNPLQELSRVSLLSHPGADFRMRFPRWKRGRTRWIGE